MTTTLVSGTLGLAKSVLGVIGYWEAEVIFGDGRIWTIRWNRRNTTATVFDAEREPLGWMEAAGWKRRIFRATNGAPSPVALARRWFAWRAVFDGEEKKLVFSLDGAKRVFGWEKLLITHRDFKSEVTFRCEPGLELPAVILAFLLFNVPNL